MLTTVMTLGAFCASFFLHSVVHRRLKSSGTHPISSMGSYIFGIMVLGWCAKTGLLSYPMSSFILYGLLTALSFALYFPVLLSGQTPAAVILQAFERRQSMTLEQIESLFSEKNLIWIRLDELTDAGLIQKNGETYVVTQKGKSVIGAVRFYRAWTGLPVGG